MINKKPISQDEKYVLTSSCWFFDVLYYFKNLHLNIPECLLFDNCFPKSWYFTSQKKGGIILRKKREKINYQYLQRDFAPKVNTLLAYNDNSTQKYFIQSEQFQQMLQEPKSFINIVLLQINNKNLNLTTLYFIYYTRKNQLMPYKTKIYKYNNKNEYNFVYSKEIKNAAIRSNDERQNQIFSDAIAKCVVAMEKSFNFFLRIYKTNFCFVYIDDQSLFLIGIMKMKVKLINKFNWVKPSTQEIEAAFLFEQLSHHIPEQPDNLKSLPPIIDNTDQRFSHKLFSVLRKDVCSGDFCEFILIDENRQSLVIRKKIIKDFQSTQSVKNRVKLNRILTDEISNDFIYKCRTRAKEVVEILKQNKVFHYKSPLHYQDDLICNEKEEFPILMKQDMRVLNKSEKYKFQKICSNCFTVYALLQNKLQDKEKTKLKQNTNDSIEKPISRMRSFLDEFSEEEPFQRSTTQRLTLSYENEKYQSTSFKSVSEKRSQTPIKRRESQKIMLLNVLESYKMKQEQEKAEYFERSMNVSTQQMESSRLHLGVMSFTKQAVNQKKIEYDLQNLDKPAQKYGSYKLVNLFKIFGITNKNILRRLTTFVQAKSEKERQKRKVIQYIYIQLIQQRVTELHINKQQLREMIADDVQSIIQETPNFVIFELSSSHYYFTNRFKHIRTIPKFKLDSPMQAMEQQQIIKLKEFPFFRFKEFSNYPYCHNLLLPVIEKIQYYIHDIFIAIPFLILNSPQNSEEIKLLIVICDIFSSFTEYINLFKQIASDSFNLQILLFNLPGQAFTFYHKKMFLDALQLAEVVDGLIYKVAEEQTNKFGTPLDWTPEIKIIGLGLGGFIAQSFCLLADHATLRISQLLLVNSLQRLDNQVLKNLSQYDEVIKNTPGHLNELPYSYYSILYNSPHLTQEQLEQKMLINPIFKEGRRVLINGILKSHDLKALQIRKLNLDILVVHSLNNNFMEDQTENYKKLQNCDRILKEELIEESGLKHNTSQKSLFPDSKHKGSKLKIFDKRKENRRIEYVEGPYAFWDNNEEFLKKIIVQFLDDNWKELK